MNVRSKFNLRIDLDEKAMYIMKTTVSIFHFNLLMEAKAIYRFLVHNAILNIYLINRHLPNLSGRRKEH